MDPLINDYYWELTVMELDENINSNRPIWNIVLYKYCFQHRWDIYKQQLLVYTKKNNTCLQLTFSMILIMSIKFCGEQLTQRLSNISTEHFLTATSSSMSTWHRWGNTTWLTRSSWNISMAYLRPSAISLCLM